LSYPSGLYIVFYYVWPLILPAVQVCCPMVRFIGVREYLGLIWISLILSLVVAHKCYKYSNNQTSKHLVQFIIIFMRRLVLISPCILYLSIFWFQPSHIIPDLTEVFIGFLPMMITLNYSQCQLL